MGGWSGTDLRSARRIVVAGASGSGKTTLADLIAARTGLPRTELDSLHWHAGWTPNPAFPDEVRRLAAADSWVVEWQYAVAKPLLAERAQVVVMLDLPRATVLARVVRRTVRRRLRRVELWNGNIEPAFSTFFTDPDHIVRWSARSIALVRPQLRALLREHPQIVFVRIRRRRDQQRLLALLDAREANVQQARVAPAGREPSPEPAETTPAC